MKVLLILKRSGIAGVETLAMRMVETLASYGVDVHVLLAIRGHEAEFLEHITRHATLHVNRAIFNEYRRNGADSFDYIYAFEMYGLCIGSMLKRRFFKQARLCFGVYHPLEYGWQGPQGILWKTARTFMSVTPDENIFFMNEGVKRRHQRNLGRSFERSPLIPVGINLERFNAIQRSPTPGKIVSIGRITDFKTYNFHMVDVTSRLRAEGHDVIYEIYGDGEQFTELQDFINERGANEFVHLKGPIPYQKITEVLCDAYAFVGCGTAMLEASAAGVPSLVAIESSPTPESLGFFSDTNGYNVGEIEPESPRYPLFDQLDSLLRSDANSYEALCAAHIERARSFDIKETTQLFIASLKNTSDFSAPVGILRFFAVFFSFISATLLNKAKMQHALTRRYVELK